MNLGGLSNLNDRVAASDLSVDAKHLIGCILRRMAEIDSRITCSHYNGGDDSKDQPPTGDDFNELWDAIQDEINEVM